MAAPNPVTFDVAEQFPNLPHAPIIEAVIDFRTRVESPWTEAEVGLALKAALPEYPTSKQMHGFSVSFQVAVGPSMAAPQQSEAGPPRHDVSWIGFRIESADGRSIGMFTRDGFTFSRLQPYRDWTQFSSEALRLWSIHQNLAHPSEIQRAGVRFINRLEVSTGGLAFGDYFRGLGSTPANLPVSGFLYRDVLSLPPYAVNVIRTFQPPDSETPPTLALLLDIDAFSLEPFAPDLDTIESRLAEMHWLKNRVFFDSLTEKALELCR